MEKIMVEKVGICVLILFKYSSLRQHMIQNQKQGYFKAIHKANKLLKPLAFITG